MRPWIESANPVVNVGGGQRPVDQPFFLCELRRIRRSRVDLAVLRARSRQRYASMTLRAGRHRGRRAPLRRRRWSRPGRSDASPSRTWRRRRALHHPHDGHAGFGHRQSMTARCTGAAPRYLGSSDAWTLIMPKRGSVSTMFRDDASVSRNDPERRAASVAASADLGDLEAAPAGTPEARAAGRALTGRVGDLLAAAARAIGLRNDADDGREAESSSCSQRGHRETRRPEEHDAHWSTICRRAPAS